jgi:glycosyltransferase-like protein
MARPPRIALTTYSVKARGGVVHTLELAEALQDLGVDVTVVAMGDPDVGFFRDVSVPTHIVEAPRWADSLEERVFSWISAMTTGLADIQDRFDIVHAQDCISARAAARIRDGGAPFCLLRTVHHVDDFTTQALIDCQAAAIAEPDHVLVVSELWRRLLAEEYGVDATVVTNGVRTDRFAGAALTGDERDAIRAEFGAADRHVFLTVGGIEPRKGSKYLIRALSELKHDDARPTMLAVVGGHSFQDYREYREEALGSLDRLGLRLDDDIVMLVTVPDDRFPELFHAADSFAFPSVKEGWGMVILEALAAGLPVVASDIPVFGEFLEPDVDAVMTRAADVTSLAAGMRRLRDDTDLAARLRAQGPITAARYSWTETARQHIECYRRVRARPVSSF